MSGQSSGPWSNEVWRASSRVYEGPRTLVSWALGPNRVAGVCLQPQLRGSGAVALRSAPQFCPEQGSAWSCQGQSISPFPPHSWFSLFRVTQWTLLRQWPRGTFYTDRAGSLEFQGCVRAVLATLQGVCFFCQTYSQLTTVIWALLTWLVPFGACPGRILDCPILSVGPSCLLR